MLLDEESSLEEAFDAGIGRECRAGGTLSLRDREPHGLVVRMRLPVRQQAKRSVA
jgi:hypothetical protein